MARRQAVYLVQEGCIGPVQISIVVCTLIWRPLMSVISHRHLRTVFLGSGAAPCSPSPGRNPSPSKHRLFLVQFCDARVKGYRNTATKEEKVSKWTPGTSF
ncbi:hypothetical protein LY78DRAFT_482013 [Colletotrichum sublineola]|nr:hypothetical protein LY78DRAFT_482013 [Colletotrichum sublineola]